MLAIIGLSGENVGSVGSPYIKYVILSGDNARTYGLILSAPKRAKPPSARQPAGTSIVNACSSGSFRRVNPTPAGTRDWASALAGADDDEAGAGVALALF